MFENVTFEEVVTETDCDGHEDISIILLTHYNDGMVDEIKLTKYGTYTSDETAKCVIFPKGKTTWEGFIPPTKFKGGDVVISTSNNVHLISCRDKNNGGWESCCGIIYGKFDSTKTAHVIPARLATEDEKEKLFNAIKENGYRWDNETKTLVKLPKFKVGDRVKHISAYASGIVVEVTNNGYHIEYPKAGGFCYIGFELEKDYELAPNKFDITTLKPFDSRVLVREDKTDIWRPTFYGFFNQHSKRFYTTSCGTWLMCIPYNENTMHLTGTTNDCDDFYKTWEK